MRFEEPAPATVDVAATVVDLAVRGHLTLEETESGLFGRSDWRLTRTGTQAPGSAPLHPYEQRLLDGMSAAAAINSARGA